MDSLSATVLHEVRREWAPGEQLKFYLTNTDGGELRSANLKKLLYII